MTLTKDTIDILTMFIPFLQEDGKTVILPHEKMNEYFDIKSIVEIKKTMATIINSAEWVRQEDGEYLALLIKEAVMKDDTEEIEIHLSEYAQEHIEYIQFICDAEKQKFLLSLSSTYAKRMYLYIQEVFKTYVTDIKNGKTSYGYAKESQERIDEFKEYMGVSHIEGYNNFTNFNNKCIVPSVCEINDKTDVILRYEPISDISRKRSYTSIIFRITVKPEKEKKELLDNIRIRLRKRI